MTMITCHALDAVSGHHAAGLRVRLMLVRDNETDRELLFDLATDEGGRLHVPVDLGPAAADGDRCEICFELGAYVACQHPDRSGGPARMQALVIRFSPDQHATRLHFPVSITPASASVLMLALAE
ncbi:MAG: hypothetical protein EP306_10105 [Burkholderiales bacterium]|nr:MAG: hypothetical protein EP306_10105 [Burkholderiales bacterium]